MTKIRKLTASGLGGLDLTAASSQQTTWAIPVSVRSLVMAIFLVVASPPILHAAFVDGIEVISQSYQISAQWSETWAAEQVGGAVGPLIPPTTGGYSVSSSDGTPLAASTTSPDGYLTANASIGEFSLQNYERSPEFVEALLNGFLYHGQVSITASALGVWDFRAIGLFLNLNLAVNASYISYPGSYVTVKLTDTTTSTTLVDLVYPESPLFPSYTFAGTFFVNPSDVYELSMDALVPRY